MKWDCGALSKYRNNSSVFRYLSNKPPAYMQWPDGYLTELGIFLHTPGISRLWAMENFKLRSERIDRVRKVTRHLAHLGYENMLTATYDDAFMFMKYKPHWGHVPIWVRPFVTEDLKTMSYRQVQAKWGCPSNFVASLRNGRSVDVFYSC